MEPLPTLAPYAHINDSSDEEEAEEFVPAVLQVNQLFQHYEEGLGLVGRDDQKAVDILSEILNHPLALKAIGMSPKVSEPIYYRAKHLYRASLKVLGGLLAQHHESTLKALELWREAVTLEPSDVALWYKIGKLALEAGQSQLAWYAFEQGLSLRPKHVPMLERFMECCLDLDDLLTCRNIAARLVDMCHGHKRARALIRCLDDKALEGECGGNRKKKRPAEEEILRPQVKRRPVAKLRTESSREPVKSFPIFSLTWENVAAVVAEVITAAPFESLGENMPSEATQSISGSAAVLHVHAPNNVQGVILNVQSASEPESNLDGSQPETDDQQDELCKTLSEVAPEMEPTQSRQNHRPKRKAKRDKPANSGANSNTMQNVMELFADSLGLEVWDSLQQSTTDGAQATPPDELVAEGTSSEDLEDLVNIRSFLLNLKGCSVMEAASNLLEKRMTCGEIFKGKEASYYLTIDAAMHPWFQATPYCSLSLAELHMDAIVDAVAGEDKGVGKESPRDLRKHVECCDQHLSRLHKISVEAALQVTTMDNILLNTEASLRFQWTQARLLWFQKDFVNAGKELLRCLSTCESLGTEVQLVRCLHDTVIRASAIRKKLSQLEVIEKLNRVEAFLSKGMHNEVMSALSPLLLRREGNQGSAELMLTGDQLLRGLQALKEAALHVGDQETVLLVHLRLLEVVLPGMHLPSSEDAIALHTSHVDVPPPALASCITLRVNFKPRFTEVEDFIEFCRGHLDMLRSPHNFSELTTESSAELTNTAFVKSLHHLEWCYWRIATPVSDSTQEIRRRKALHDAAGLVFCLHQVYTSFHNDVDSVHKVCSALFSLLRDRSAVSLSLSNGLKHDSTIHLIAGVISSMIWDDNGQEEGYWASPNKPVQLLSQCLESLYGLKLCPRKQSASTAVMDKDERDPINVQDALSVWAYVEPYLSKLARQNSDQFESCEELLMRLAEVIPPPPDEVLEKIGPDRLLQCEDSSDELTAPPEWMHPEFPDRLEALQGLEFRSIYESLYYWAGLSTVRSALDLVGNEGVLGPLGPKGSEMLEQQVKILKLDLAFNPDRIWTWEALAIAYKEDTNTILECGARELPPNVFLESPEVVERLENGLRYQKRCFTMLYLMSQKVDLDDEQASAQDMLAEIYYCRVQKCPPIYYKFHKDAVPSEEFRKACQNAFSWWKASMGIFQDEWSFPYYMGKMVWKLKEDGYAAKAMDYFAQAVHLANLHEGGLVDPIHKLHSIRLKLLTGGSTDWRLLTKYMFDPVTLPAEETGSAHDEEMTKVVLGDCREALEYCRGKVGFYHRVHYHLALAYFGRGNYEGADSHIRQLFTQGKKIFCFSLTRIDPEAYSGGKKRGTQCKSRRTSPTGDSYRSTPVEDCPMRLWGTRPSTISGPGLEEPPRKFAGAIRKYLMLYMKVLFFMGDVDTLDAAAKGLHSGKVEGAQELRSEHHGTHLFLDDMAQRALGVYLLSLHKKLGNLFPPEAARTLDEQSQRRGQEEPVDGVPDSCVKELQHAYNALCELAVEPENVWPEAIEAALKDVLPAGAVFNSADAATVSRDLRTYACGFVLLLEQNKDIESIESLALALKKRGSKQGSRQQHPLSPMKMLASQVCRSAMRLVEQKLTAVNSDYCKRSFMTESHLQILSKGMSQLVNVGKGLEQNICGPLRDSFASLCVQLYGLYCKSQGKMNDVDAGNVRLSHLLRRCEEATSRPRAGESKKLSVRKSTPSGVSLNPVAVQDSSAMISRNEETMQVSMAGSAPMPFTYGTAGGPPFGPAIRNQITPANVPLLGRVQVEDAPMQDSTVNIAQKKPTSEEGQDVGEGAFATSFNQAFQSGTSPE